MTPGQAASFKAACAQYSPPEPAVTLPTPDPRSAEQRHRDQDLQAYAVLGELMQRVPVGIRIGTWEIGSGSISAHISAHRLSDHEIRGRVMQLAEQFDLNFSEYQLSGAPSQNRVSAHGHYKDVPVRFWQLVTPCLCEDCGARL